MVHGGGGGVGEDGRLNWYGGTGCQVVAGNVNKPSGQGGSPAFGGTGGGSVNTNAAGIAGNMGGGGSGAADEATYARAGGNGSAGFIMVWEFE